MTTSNRKLNTSWTFLTNHAHVLICLVKSPAARIRDLAATVGITQRSVQRILADLSKEGYIETIQDGRSNTYIVDGTKPLKHPIESHRTTADLIRLMRDDSDGTKNATHPSEDESHARARGGRD